MTVGVFMAAVRHLLREGGNCPACGKRPEVWAEESLSIDRRIDLFSQCHGSTDARIVIVPRHVDGGSKVVADVMEWRRGLFAMDARPDIKELLHYNAKPFTGAA